jgi:hypothetical protein
MSAPVRRSQKKSRRLQVLKSACAEQTGTGGIAVKPFMGFVNYFQASTVPLVLQSEEFALRAR